MAGDFSANDVKSAPQDNGSFIGFLERSGALDHSSGGRARSALKQSAQSVDTVLLELGLIEEERLAEAQSQFLGLTRIAGSDFPAELEESFVDHKEFLRRAQLIPVNRTTSSIEFATASPLGSTSARSLAYLLGLQLSLRVATRSEMLRQVERLLSESSGIDTSAYSASHDDMERLRDVASEAPIIRLLNRVMARAVEGDASDIHIEMLDDHLRIRFRVDGQLQEVERLDRNLHLGLVSRIKILSRLNIAEQRLPQDGRLSIAVKGRDVDLRVATVPASYGENVVLRILDKGALSLDFASLGFSEQAEKQINRLLASPHGIILVTGPTGSGKTTTLYAALTSLNKPNLKIFSIEDPVEYNIRGINQILVRPQIDLTFATILRSVLRQDPDVIMVGEIRDRETAQIAVQAALTGHLVLSTLHTNSAAASLTRLQDLGVDDFLINSSVRAVIAQRLVRKLCSSCRGKGRDCNTCQGSGYRGRTVVYEIIEMTDEIRDAITRKREAKDIEKIAKSDGFKSLLECGEKKIAAGETTRAELLRVVGAGVP